MDPPSLRIPDGIEPIVGFRCWQYAMYPTGAWLGSPSRYGSSPSGRSLWKGAGSRWVEARCLLSRDRAHRYIGTCGCGVAAEFGFPADGCPVCSSPPEVPDEACTCGFYAMRDLTPELIEAVAPSWNWELSGRVVGRVLLAGKVIEYEMGYRAQLARIAELIPVEGTEWAVRQLAERLGLPVGLTP
jgi:hypothetical protein